MSQKLLDVLSLGHCSHEFSWPRRAADGNYYQVCLLCATQYKYDWKAMRRTEKVRAAEAGNATPLSRTAGRNRKPTWVPRARRLKLNMPMRYRAKGQTLWHEAKIDNLSQSGLLFRGMEPLPPNTLVEMIFEMPEEISGQKNSNVLCQGRIIRSQESRQLEGNSEFAASVLDYKFIHQKI